MLKATIAIVAGFVLWTVLFLGGNAAIVAISADSFNADGSTDSIAMLVLLLCLSFVYSIVSGFVCSLMARHYAFYACLTLGIILLLVGVAAQLQYWNVIPIWYHLIFLIALIPAVFAGYAIAHRRRI